MSTILKEGITYKGMVAGISPAADKFKKTTGNMAIVYCHYLSIVTEDNQLIKAQICNEHQDFVVCTVNDDVSFQITKYAKERYTLSNVSVVASAQSKLPARKQSPAVNAHSYAGFEGEPFIDNFDIVLAGEPSFDEPTVAPAQKVAEAPVGASTKYMLMGQAMNSAALLMQMRGMVSDEEYLSLVDKLYNKLLNL